MQKRTSFEDGIIEEMTYNELEDKLVVKTTYDATDVIEENAVMRSSGDMPMFGSKNQRMILAARVPEAHVIALRNLGYDLLSPDPQESHRALLYLKHNQQAFLTTDKEVIAERKVIWQ